MLNSLMNMYHDGNYGEVASVWENEQKTEQFNEWDFIAIANSFYKLNRYDKCLEIYKAFKKSFPDSDKLDEKLGWALYHTKVKGFDFEAGNIKQLLRQIDYIMEHGGNGRYSAKWQTVKFVLKAVDDGKLVTDGNSQLVKKYLDCIDPATLSTEANSVKSQDGKTHSTSSDKEEWYSKKSKVLLKLNEYDECIECCDEALRVLPNFHNNNNGWFMYRKAKSLQALGKNAEAKSYIQHILSLGLTHWCMLQTMYELERAEGNTEKALSYAGACAVADREHKMRVKFYPDFANFLDEVGKHEEAMLHRRLVSSLRDENEWKQKAYQNGWQFTPEIAKMDGNAVIERLTPFWIELRDRFKEYLTGTVQTLLGEGDTGFIEADNGERYYFNARDFRGNKKEISVGTRVRFTLADRLDRSKGIVKKNAVEISTWRD